MGKWSVERSVYILQRDEVAQTMLKTRRWLRSRRDLEFRVDHLVEPSIHLHLHASVIPLKLSVIMYTDHRSLRRIYFVLVVLRAWFALFGTGYIHPDEYFQNGEVMAGMV